jgi:threonylcarbamoyladenosine tRNA methylthiotransferase MtaB
MHQRTCRFVTLGCKVNQYDTQLVREALFNVGFREAAGDEPADLCVVNTCTVTQQADTQGRYEIRKLLRRNPGAEVLVMGCYAARDPDEVTHLPGVSAVVAHRDQLGDVLRRFGVERLPRGIARFDGHHRAFVKVQDGCLLKCTFCIIPQVRPSLRSRPPEEIEAEVERLVAAGFREIVLTGIHLGHYGIEFSAGRPRADWCRLADLVRRLTQIPGRWRLRLSNLDAAEVTDDLIAAVATEPRVCPHLHICLQSGSDRVLSAMDRRYRVAGFLRRIDAIRRRLEQPALTTDVIVGFPGESDHDFEATVDVCQRVGFSKVHVFPFSPRRGTVAASMDAQIPEHVVLARKTQLQALESRLAERYHQSLVGRCLEVLVERPADGNVAARGTACRYVTVQMSGGAMEYDLVQVVATAAAADHLRGDVLSPRLSPELPILEMPRNGPEVTLRGITHG